jgi:hypothetical protein
MKITRLKEILRDILAKNEISIAYFVKFSDNTKDIFDEVLSRIMLAFGIDFTSKDSRINFEVFVRIKCFLQFNSLEWGELVKLWSKILNPAG